MSYVWLRRWFTTTRCKSMIVGAGMTVLNAGVIILLVQVCGLWPWVANIARFGLTTILHFGLCYLLLSKEPRPPLLRRLRTFTRHKLGITAAAQVGFFLLVIVGVPCFIAYGTCVIAKSMVNLKSLPKMFDQSN